MAESETDKSEDGKSATTVARKSDREIVATRIFDAPAHIIFEAWTNPALFKRWWLPRSMGMTMVSCEMDVCTGGHYRLQIGHPASNQPMAFFGRYLEVVPASRLVWTNEENAEGNVTTVTFEEVDGKTLVVFHELYPSKEALDEEMSAAGALPEQLDQLNELLAAGDVKFG